jgi:hypothetical protein
MSMNSDSLGAKERQGYARDHIAAAKQDGGQARC